MVCLSDVSIFDTAVGVIVALAVRSLIKQKKSGGGCNGDCGHCKGCH